MISLTSTSFSSSATLDLLTKVQFKALQLQQWYKLTTKSEPRDDLNFSWAPVGY